MLLLNLSRVDRLIANTYVFFYTFLSTLYYVTSNDLSAEYPPPKDHNRSCGEPGNHMKIYFNDHALKIIESI